MKFVISFGATKENTVQVETVPLKSLQVTPLTLEAYRGEHHSYCTKTNTYLAVPICDPAGPALR